MPELLVIARHTMKAALEEEVLALVPKLCEASRAEPGCLGFVAYRQMDEPRTYVLLERYASREAFAAHRESPHFKDLVLGQIVPRLEARTVEQFEAAG